MVKVYTHTRSRLMLDFMTSSLDKSFKMKALPEMFVCMRAWVGGCKTMSEVSESVKLSTQMLAVYGGKRARERPLPNDAILMECALVRPAEHETPWARELPLWDLKSLCPLLPWSLKHCTAGIDGAFHILILARVLAWHLPRIIVAGLEMTS